MFTRKRSRVIILLVAGVTVVFLMESMLLTNRSLTKPGRNRVPRETGVLEAVQYQEKQYQEKRNRTQELLRPHQRGASPPVLNEKQGKDVLEFYSKSGLKIGNVQHAELFEGLYKNQVEGAKKFMTTLQTNSQENPILEVHFPIFNISAPDFIAPEDESRFFKYKGFAETAGKIENDPKKLMGHMELIHDGSADERFDCGWQKPLDKWKTPSQLKLPSNRDDLIVPLLTPDGDSFQHFIDGALPKLALMAPFLKNEQIKYLILWPKDEIIFEMLKKLGIKRDQLIGFQERQVVSLTYQLNICMSPPVHPVLWQQMRSLLGVQEHLQLPYKEALVVLLSRAKARNKGRNIRNFQEVVEFLQQRYGDKLLVYYGGFTLAESMRTFGSARLIVGVHGGGFYNLLYSPKETVVVEYLAQNNNGEKSPASGSHAIMWVMSKMLGQQYYRVVEDPLTRQGDINISVEKLAKILDQVDRKQGLKPT